MCMYEIFIVVLESQFEVVRCVDSYYCIFKCIEGKLLFEAGCILVELFNCNLNQQSLHNFCVLVGLTRHFADTNGPPKAPGFVAGRKMQSKYHSKQNEVQARREIATK